MFNNTRLQGNTNNKKKTTTSLQLDGLLSQTQKIGSGKDNNAHYWLECKLVCVSQYGTFFKKLYSALHSDPIPHCWMYIPRK